MLICSALHSPLCASSSAAFSNLSAFVIVFYNVNIITISYSAHWKYIPQNCMLATTCQQNKILWTRVLSSIFEGLVMMTKILLSTWFERITFGANHMTLMIIYKKQMNLVTFWFGRISKWFGGPPCPPSWRESWITIVITCSLFLCWPLRGLQNAEDFDYRIENATITKFQLLDW